jgi:hypothetical protein
MKMKKILILATTMLLFGAVNAQSLKTVEQIKAANQKCLNVLLNITFKQTAY